MSADFVGLTVIVKLKSPPSTFQGLVVNVQGQRLFLRDVHFHASGKRLKDYVVHGLEIDDIEVASNEPGEVTSTSATSQNGHKQEQTQPQSSPSAITPSQPIPLPQAPLQQQQALHHPPQAAQKYTRLLPAQIRLPKQFVDPAILSFTKTSTAGNQRAPQPASKPELTVGPSSAKPKVHPSSSHETSSSAPVLVERVQSDVAETLSTHFDYLVIDNKTHQVDQAEVVVTTAEDDPNENSTTHVERRMDVAETVESIPIQSRKRLRPNKKRPAGTSPLDIKIVPSLAAARNAVGIVEMPSPSDWNQGSVLENEPAQSQFTSSRIPSATFAGHTSEYSSGWRQTPILQEPQPTRHVASPTTLRPEVTAKNAELAAHTGNKRKHKGERRKMKREVQNGWATEEATDIQEMGDFDFAGNLSMFDKRAVFDELREADNTADEDRLVSFNRLRPGTFGGKHIHPTENVLDQPAAYLQMPAHPGSPIGDEVDLDGSVGSTRLRRDLSIASAQQPTSRKSSIMPLVKPCFRYMQTGHIISAVTPGTLDAIEELANVQLGLSEDLIAENAARGIVEIVLSAINPGGRRLQSTQNTQPVIVILCGETKTGARGLAAARHLQERGIRVVSTIPGPVDYAHGPLSAQLQRLGGKAIRTWKETAAFLKTLDAPPELIIDALNGSTGTPFTHPDPIHAATAVEMMGWANKSKASVLAIDRPSGVDPITGEVEVWEGEPAEIRAKLIGCLGTPTLGLLRATELRGNEDGWRISVVDVGLGLAGRMYLRGLSAAERRRAGKGDLVTFGAEWVVGLLYDAGEPRVA